VIKLKAPADILFKSSSFMSYTMACKIKKTCHLIQIYFECVKPLLNKANKYLNFTQQLLTTICSEWNYTKPSCSLETGLNFKDKHLNKS
jgi:hypothetical protein